MLQVSPDQFFALPQLIGGQSLASVPGASIADVSGVEECLLIVSDAPVLQFNRDVERPSGRTTRHAVADH